VKGGIAGRIADAFLTSRLTPLLMAATLVLGVASLFTMPSEEDPQIIVPLADIYLPMPGYTPEEIENRALIPLEQVISGIAGVKYVYSHAESGFGLLTVRYKVGEDMERSLVKLYAMLLRHADRMPPGLAMPLVKTVTIDDVPFFTVALTGSDPGTDASTAAGTDPGTDADTDAGANVGTDVGAAELRRIAEELRPTLEAIPDVRDISVIGGSPREIRVALSPGRLARYHLDPAGVAARIRAANVQVDAGRYTSGDSVVRVVSGLFLRSAADVAGVVLDVYDGRLVQVGDVAEVTDGPAETSTYTWYGRPGAQLTPMVTLAIAKRPGADATRVGRRLEQTLERARGRILPSGVSAVVTRNYGETARDKVQTLKLHLLVAILAVGLVVTLAMGWRGGLVVMTAVPITFSLTLFVYHLFGYTLNRVTLFALIFVTGIVVDDSIIIAENMERHFAMRDRPLRVAARAAVDEVGNPTILATLTVIAAVLPMLFVSGLMGPYMSPMPIGASLAMTFSLMVALVVAPWLAYRLMGRPDEATRVPAGEETDAAEAGKEPWVLENTRMYRLYGRLMTPLMDHPRRLVGILAGTALLLVAATGLFFTRVVAVKMLPFDDKSEMEVVVDMPEGTSLESTAAFSAGVARVLAAVPEIASLQLYVGTAAPFNFNGMIRHYYLRRGPNVADIQLNLVARGERAARSHEIAGRVRPLLDSLAVHSGTGARLKVVEVPPGPPVLATLVAEVYGREPETRDEAARRVKELFERQPGVVDVDWSLRAAQREDRFVVDEERAAVSEVNKRDISGALAAGLGGTVATYLSAPASRVPVPVRVRLTEASRSGADRLAELYVPSRAGSMVPVRSLVRIERGTVPQSIDRKNGRRVVYVTADVAGEEESPVYAILDLKKQISRITLPSGDPLGELYTRQPRAVDQPVLKWDGEWQVTYEVFRDLGIAFAGALVLIYVLLVGWFGSLSTPLVMMIAIPLTLVGIAPGHWAFGAFFTATSMIGMIALAGIMVRNGILLIDMLEARLAAGEPLKQAILEAGAVRTRPIVLTAGTVVIGAFVILFDPIFQGLAVSLISGAIASTVLTLLVVPGVYFLFRRDKSTRRE